MSETAATAKATIHPISIKDLDTLIKEVARQQSVVFTISEKPFSIVIRPLSNHEMAEVDKITSFLPPRRKEEVQIAGKKEMKESSEYDFQDPEYKTKMARAVAQKSALIISMGVVDMKVPGETLDEKAAHINGKLPPDIVNLLVNSVLKLSNDDIKVLDMANFTLGDASLRS